MCVCAYLIFELVSQSFRDTRTPASVYASDSSSEDEDKFENCK